MTLPFSEKNNSRGRRPRVVVGLSGGVDSAVAALLLQRQGYDVRAVFMKNWSEDDFGGPCPWAEDQASASAVADYLKIPLQTWNFEAEYQQRVFKVMLHEYERGRTPNPDILCNREIKFSLFLERAKRIAPLIATGHYARTKDGRLYKGIDRDKDQSYFLAAVSSVALKRTLFPIGSLKKPAVREIAKKAGLPNWDRPDSTGICFIGEKKMVTFLSRYIAASPGPIELSDGTVIGQHIGLPFYTIGQRHGFSGMIDQSRVAQAVGAGKPLYVKEKIPTSNKLIVATTDLKEELASKEFILSEPQWVANQPTFPWIGRVKLRYRQPDISVMVRADRKNLRAICHEPQRAITPGQYAVFYHRHECLGCAVIERAIY